MAGPITADLQRHRAALARTLAADALTVRVSEAFRAEGIDALFLKGPSISNWIYDDAYERPYGDVDVLVGAAGRPAAERLLARMGMVNRYQDVAPAWARQHADPWVSPTGVESVDLHRWLWGLHDDPDRLWDHLWGTRTQMELQGHTIEVLGEAERALALCLHAAHHADVSPKAIEDVRRGVDVLDEGVWTRARDVAAQFSVTRWMATGLRLVPDGAALSDRLGLDSHQASPGDIRAWSISSPTTRMLRFAATEGVSAKGRMVWGEMFPSKQFMRSMSGEATLARRGPAGLALAYVWRAMRVIRRLPAVLMESARQRRARR